MHPPHAGRLGKYLSLGPTKGWCFTSDRFRKNIAMDAFLVTSPSSRIPSRAPDIRTCWVVRRTTPAGLCLMNTPTEMSSPRSLVKPHHRVFAGIRRLKELCHELSTRRAFKVDFGTHVSVCYESYGRLEVLPHNVPRHQFTEPCVRHLTAFDIFRPINHSANRPWKNSATHNRHSVTIWTRNFRNFHSTCATLL